MTSVRFAGGHEDACRIYAHLVEMHDELGVGAPDHGRALDKVIQLLRDEAVLIAEDGEGRIVGSLALELWPLWYAAPRAKALMNLWLFVPAERRRGPITRLLIAEAKSLANEMNVPLIISRSTVVEQ